MVDSNHPRLRTTGGLCDMANMPVESSASLVIGLGELLWDCFPAGRLPGGAPANVAFHAQQLGLPAAAATRVGTDALGDELLAFLGSKGLQTDLVQRDPLHGTGTVTVSPRSDGHTDYVFLENSAWDFLEATPAWNAAFATARAVAFGTLAQRGAISRAAIHACVRATAPDCLVVYDINLRPPFYDRAWIAESLSLARVVKLNDDESRILAEMFSVPETTPVAVAQHLLKQFPRLELVCITRGGNGAIGITRSETVEVPGVPVTVVDTVGAGDAFTAALISGRLAQQPLGTTLQFANRVGSLVASRPGAMPDLRDVLPSR